MAVVLVEAEWFLLSGTIDVGIVLEQFLDACQDRFDSQVWLPVLLLVQDAEAHCSRGVDVGVRQDWLEDALGRTELGEAYRMG